MGVMICVVVAKGDGAAMFVELVSCLSNGLRELRVFNLLCWCLGVYEVKESQE